MKSIAPDARGLSADLCCCSFVIPLLMPDCIMVTVFIAACRKARVLPWLAASVLGPRLMASCSVGVPRLCNPCVAVIYFAVTANWC